MNAFSICLFSSFYPKIDAKSTNKKTLLLKKDCEVSIILSICGDEMRTFFLPISIEVGRLALLIPLRLVF